MNRPRPESDRLFARAQELIPGGVNSPVRAFRGVGGTPVFVRRASGAWFEDVDGHRYIDYVGSWGPMILGHAHPAVIEAIGRAALDGTSFGCPTSLENDMAELLQELMPSLERVRMVSSGTEATLSAIRLARGFTGRTKLLKFAGNYHGHGDSLLVEAGSGVATLGIPGTPGILPEVAAHTLTVEYNDLEAVDAVFARHGDDIAAVIVEPVAGNMGLVPPRPGFLGRLRSRCDESGALLIFDEVMTGFRVALGGAQALFGVRPDLTTIGKIVGGGLPAAAYGGRSDIMLRVAPAGDIYQAGTLSGNPLAMTAGITTLRLLRDTPGLHDDLARRTQRLAEGLAAEARSAGHPAVAQYVGAMFSVFFSSEPVWSYADARRSNASLFRGWFHAMLDRGVYLAPSAFEAAFVGAAHSDAIIDETLDIAKAAFASV
jgi:glutamate-1-semialdehyde 2,1-aminomutase